MEKLLNKEAIRKVIRDYYDNDERITDKLLFDGKRMTIQCYALLQSMFDNHYSEVRCLDELGYHCYVTYTYPCNNEYAPYHEQEAAVVKPELEKLYKQLDSLVADDECYFVSDVISGERDDNSYRGQRGISQGTRWCSIDIWLFSDAGKVTEFVDSNEAKCKLLLD